MRRTAKNREGSKRGFRKVALGVAVALFLGFGAVAGSMPVTAAEPSVLSPVIDKELPPDPPPGTRVRVGILQFEQESSYGPTLDNIQEDLIGYLQRATKGLDIVAVPYDSSDRLKAAVARHEVEFFLASSGLYVELQRYGVRDIGTLVLAQMPDPNQCVAGVLVARADRSDITDLASLKGKRAISTDPANFMTFQTNMGEVAKAGFDPEGFFSGIEFTHNRPKAVIEAVIDGKADVGLLRACMPEALVEKHPAWKGKLKVVNQQETPAGKRLGCAFSTDLYPGWTVAVANHTPAVITRHLATALLALSPEDTQGGYTISYATDFERVNDVFKRLRIGPYAYLRDWTVERVVTTYWPVLMLVLAGLLLWALHAWRLERLVVRRTRALAEALRREKEASDLARTTSEKLTRLERVGMIGKLSSVFAHEFVQPLSAMRYSARSLGKLMARETVDKPLADRCLKELSEQLKLATSIIERVRSYAKEGADRSKPVDLAALVLDVKREMTESRRLKREVTVDYLTPPGTGLLVAGDGVELRVLLMNLFKNAEEALSAAGLPEPIAVTIGRLEGKDAHEVLEAHSTEASEVSPETTPETSHETAPEGSVVRLVVRNGGARLTYAQLAELAEPLATTKERGLGLGLLLCKSIAEVHRASIRFEAPDDGGVRVTIDFPAYGGARAAA